MNLLACHQTCTMSLMDVVKAKIAIVNDSREILILTRSEMEDTRVGELDLPGGTLDASDIEVVRGAIRETSEELPGIDLDSPIEIGVDAKPNELGQLVMTYIFGATARFPSSGINLSFEHSSAEWIALDEILKLKNRPRRLPTKYRRAIEASHATFDKLISLAPVS